MAVSLAAVLSMTSLAVVEDPVSGSPAADPPEWLEDVDVDAWGASAGPEEIPWEESSSAPLVLPGGSGVPLEGEVEPAAEEPVFPAAAAWEVELAGDGGPAAVVEGSVESTDPDAEVVDVGDLPVSITAGSADAVGERLRVEVFDRAVAELAGSSGFVFAVDAASEGASVADVAGGEALPVEVGIDYSDFAGAYGGDYATRLAVVALPVCALTEPRAADCPAQGTRVDASNDLEDGRLVVEVPDLAALASSEATGPSPLPGSVDPEAVMADDPFGEADIAAEAAEPPVEGADVPDELAPFESSPLSAGVSSGDVTASAVAAEAVQMVDEGGVVLAVTSSVSGDAGNFAATPMSSASQWNVSPGSGEFSYSYPIEVPAPAGGAAPAVGLRYSSGAVDGLTLGTNTQAPPTGVGWSEFANGFIERAYEPCVNGGTVLFQDLCWRNWNATISLGGIGGVLTPIDAEFTQWRVENNPGWVIERVGGPEEPGVVGQHAPEYWEVTAPDGTRYTFGLHYDPDTGRGTDSVWWVPVFGDQPGEPCDGVFCDLAWRWNLDRVVDPNGNVTTYWYSREANNYQSLANSGFTAKRDYIRSGMLSRIEYGDRDGSASARPTAQVTFGLQNRCVFLVAGCPAADSDGSDAAFPDVPWDLICDTQAVCPSSAPAFFSGRRYSHVRTEVWVDDGVADANDWEPVLQYNLIHRIAMHSQTAGKMYLDGIQQVGLANAGLLPYPVTLFGFQQMANRADVDASAGVLRMVHWRVVQVSNPFGGRIDVTYFRNRPCTEVDFNQTWWDHNDKDCFPQTVFDNDHRRRGIFNKYLVSQVVESPGYGSPTMTTSYSYEGTPGWAFDWGAFDRLEFQMGWSQWRGYETTTVTQGTSTTRIRVFRGMDDDLETEVQGGQLVPTGRRDIKVEVHTLAGPAMVDDAFVLMGRTIQEAQLGTLAGVADVPLQSSFYDYEVRQTDPVDQEHEHDAPHWADVRSTIERVAVTPTEFRDRATRATYNAHLQPEESEELGWLDVTGDERCSTTTYADNPDLGMFVYPATNTTAAGACDPAGAVLAVSETLYDGATTVGAAPTRGNPTHQRTLLDATGSGTWAETSTSFDALGRPLVVTDARGNTTETTYTAVPTHAIPTQVTVENDLGQSTVTTCMPEFSVPTRQDGPNASNVTTYGYDALGRVTAVRLPTEQGMTSPATRSWQFSYQVSADEPPPAGTGGAGTTPTVVRSRQLSSITAGGTGVYEDNWVVYDGNLRERQTHVQSPTSGQVLVTDTSYDGRGLLRDEAVPEAVAGTPGQGILAPATWANRTRHLYDELGRATEDQWLRGNTEHHDTTYDYDEDTVTVTGPGAAGKQSVVAETVDGLGRTAEIRELEGVDGGGEVWATTAYGYDLADNLASITDAEGNEITYTYNMAGWRTAQDDPNRGAATFAYDPAGNQVMTQDADGAQVWTSYDDLNRPTARRSGSPTGTLLASWTYDTAPGGVGQVDQSIRHTPTGSWVTEALGYDARGRATGTTSTVPAGVPGLSGTYRVDQAYDRADRPTTTTYAAAGDLPAETVTTAYNGFGLPATMTGAISGQPSQPYVRATGYDSRRRIGNTVIGPANPTEPFDDLWMVRFLGYDADQQLTETETVNSAATGTLERVSSHEVSYDDAGRVAGRTAEVSGLGSWRECYSHDRRSRLESAFTVTLSATCAAGSAGTGDQPFDQEFAYSAGNAPTERTEDGTTTSYDYDDTGADPPYAPVTVGGVTLEWDANGNLTERTESGTTETFTWDVEQRLVSVSGPGGESSFVYDPAGQRLLRQTRAGATLYFAGQEITASPDGSTVAAVRSYSFAGSLVATRSAVGVDYLITDERGSVELAAPSLGVPSASRAYEPYGQEHSTSGAGFATDRGFLSQVEDETTSLSYLNARYYDTGTGVFVSPDPAYDTENPRSLNPYTYGLGNPTTFSDASGLSPSYILGIENQNVALGRQNRQLIAHIGRLNSQLREMQNIIVEQRNVISSLLTHISALEAIINQQAVVIRKLQTRVRELQAQVSYWRNEAIQWRTKAEYYRQWVGRFASAVYGREGGRMVLSVIDAAADGSSTARARLAALSISLARMPSPTEAAREIADLRGDLESIVSFEGAMEILDYLADDCIADMFTHSHCDLYPSLAYDVLYAEDRTTATCVLSAYTSQTSSAFDVVFGPLSEGVTDPVDAGVLVTNAVADCLP
ncbi:MAG: RHS repeat-associated core domain-containing protein [Acidimicrobiales bacterium]